MFRSACFCALIAGLLGACTGSGGDSSGGYEQQARSARELAQRVGALEQTPVERMPTTGSASYRGHAAVWADDATDPSAIADLNLQANFADATLTGRLDNWQSREDGALRGTVNLRDGYIHQNELGADLVGTVRIEGQDTAVDGTMWGTFAGADAQAAAGELAVIVGGEDYVTGIWGAERQR